jgi:hypothetical protein
MQIPLKWFTMKTSLTKGVPRGLLWTPVSEVKWPLHMILMEAYFYATRQQPMESGL